MAMVLLPYHAQNGRRSAQEISNFFLFAMADDDELACEQAGEEME
jgi:hypothetical protein